MIVLLDAKMNCRYHASWIVVCLLGASYIFYLIYGRPGRLDSGRGGGSGDYDRSTKVILELRREREANVRRLHAYNYRWQRIRVEREMLSRRLNGAMEELNRLRCERSENVTQTGAWCQWPFRNKHHFDDGLAAYLTKLLEGKSVASFGEGPGQYQRYLRQSSLVPAYDAYDGSPWIENATAHEVRYADLTVPQYGLPMYDWVLSVEVAEHVPADFEDIYLGNLIRHAKSGLVISWAIPGQVGFGHVNPRRADYVLAKLRVLCFEKSPEKTNQIRRAADVIWLKKNLLVLERRDNCTWTNEDA